MNPSSHLVLLAQNRPDLLQRLAQDFAGPSGAARLVDRQGSLIWTRAGAPLVLLEQPEAIELAEMGRFEWMTSPGSRSAGDPLASAVAALLVACAEGEAEMNQLVEDHISITNQLMALYNIVYGTHETLDAGPKLRSIVNEAGRQLGADFSVLSLDRPDSELREFWPVGDRNARSRALTALARIDLRQGPQVLPPPNSQVAAPVLVHGEPAGWLVVGGRDAHAPFLGRDLKLVQALADLAAGFLLTQRLQDSVVRSLRVEKELEIASQIQTALIPHTLPRVAGCALAAACLPASHVGGDFYAVEKLTDGSLAFALGDVTGKGVPAALIMAMTRTVFRALGSVEAGPSQVLTRLNEVLYDDLERVEKLVTLVVGRFDPALRRVTLCNAGHAPVFYRATGESDFLLLEPEAPPLGVLADLVAPTITLDLSPGALLAITSDGFTEARAADGSLYGLGRLALRLGEPIEDLTTLAHELLDDVAEFARGVPPADDQTMLLLWGTR